jgi:hypothetical protein
VWSFAITPFCNSLGLCGKAHAQRSLERLVRLLAICTIFLISLLWASLSYSGLPQSKTTEWKSVEFAIVRFNDQAPQTWNIYHTSKKGILLVKIWKRYLLVNVAEQQVFDVDPNTIKPNANGVEWSSSDAPNDPIEIADWKDRNVGPVQRIRFRFGKYGHILELQLPIGADGKPAY